MKEDKSLQVLPVQEVSAIPRKISAKESGRLAAFIGFFVPRLKKQEELALRAEEALIRKTEAEAEKTLAEAARTAAEKDRARQESLKKFCENVEGVFKPDDSREITMLKFAKLLETNPELAQQLDKVNDIIERMAEQKGFRIEPKK